MYTPYYYRIITIYSMYTPYFYHILTVYYMYNILLPHYYHILTILLPYITILFKTIRARFNVAVPYYKGAGVAQTAVFWLRVLIISLQKVVLVIGFKASLNPS